MQISYSKNYLKIYFFQTLSIVLGFMSLFVVVPYLSTDQTIYGIYSVCISITVFLSYADLGFLGAGMKFAAESYSRGDIVSEIKLVGFSHFILLIFVVLLSGGFIFLSLHPEILIKGIESGKQSHIAHQLLLILALFSPTIILQRALQMIFAIRLHDYILQKINITGNLIKIISVFYFFRNGHYEIVNYFLFMQIVNLACALFGLVTAKRKYNYDFKLLFRSFSFNSEIFNKTKSLAFSSLVATISWVLYYELDSFAIGRILGAKQVAIFAIGFTMLTFCRSLLGIFFSPFSARFNHFIGGGAQEQLKQFYLHVITITLPIVVFPIVAVAIFARPLVIAWVGYEYEKAVDIVRWLVLCNVLGFISYPTGMLLVAREKLKDIYLISILMPIIYWVGIVSTIGALEIKSFAVFKFIAFAISGIIYLQLSLKFLNISFMGFLKKNIAPFLPALILMCIGLLFLNDRYIIGKSKLYLFINASIISVGIFVAIGLTLMSVPALREYFIKTFKIILKRSS